MWFGTAPLLVFALASVVAADPPVAAEPDAIGEQVGGAKSPCPSGFVQYKKSCYWLSSTPANFAEARSICQYHDSHLARLTTKDEDDFVRKYASLYGKAANYWLGATDLNKEATWIWEGQQLMVYSNWNRGQPDNYGGAEHCLDIKRSYDNYRWNDENCMLSNVNFICEKEL